MCRTKLFDGDRQLYRIHRKWQRCIDNAKRQEKQIRMGKKVRGFPSDHYAKAKLLLVELREAIKKKGKEICSCGRISDSPLCKKCFEKELKRQMAI